MRRSLLVLSSITAACVTTEMHHRVATMDDLRVRQGACSIDDSLSRLGSPMSIISCAQKGSPGILDDDGATPFLISKFLSDSFELSNPGNWQLTLYEGGREVMKQRLPSNVPSVGICGSWGCLKNGFAISRLPEDWRPGKYSLTYVCTFDTSVVTSTTLTLMGLPGSAGQRVVVATSPAPPVKPALFAVSRPPAHPWSVEEQEAMKRQCLGSLAARYGTKRTPQQVQYSCECITWGYQDRYTAADYVTYAKQQPAAMQAASDEISAS